VIKVAISFFSFFLFGHFRNVPICSFCGECIL